jgi:hypothetical protein
MTEVGFNSWGDVARDVLRQFHDMIDPLWDGPYYVTQGDYGGILLLPFPHNERYSHSFWVTRDHQYALWIFNVR